MGGSNSRSRRNEPVLIWSERQGCSKTYTCDIINEVSINDVLRRNQYQLSYEEMAMGREAQSLANNELNRTMRNCELVMYFSNVDITLKAGGCDNRIVMQKRYNGEIEWKFTKRSFTQTVYSGVRWMGRHLSSFFGNVASIAAGSVFKMLEY